MPLSFSATDAAALSGEAGGTGTGRARRLIAEGRYFAAWDAARAAAAAEPGALLPVLLGALALLRSGAVEQARAFLAPVDGRLRTSRMELRRIAALLRETMADAAALDREEPQALERVSRLIAALREGGRTPLLGIEDVGTLRLVCEVYRELWQRLGGEADLRRARDLALDAFRQAPTLGDGIAAAELTWLLREPEDARRLAEAALAVRGVAADAPLGGLGALLRGEGAAAAERFAAARRVPGTSRTVLVDLRARVLRLAECGLDVPPAVLDALRPPTVVLFAGPPLDAPGAVPPLFPPAAEAAVRAAIVAILDDLDAEIGYSSGRIGADLIFTEAMLDRGADVTIMLPYAQEDVVAEQAGAGRVWLRRFEHATRLVSAVEYGTRERHLGHDVLERFNHRMIEGTARLRAAALDTEPHLVLLWDHAAPAVAGSAADFMDHWPDPRRLRVLDLDEIRAGAGVASAAAPVPAPSPEPSREPSLAIRQPAPGPERVIRALLFADVVDYSRFGDAEMPAFVAFMAAVAERLPREGILQVGTWGDAIHAVAAEASVLADWAFALRDAFAAIDPRSLGLEARMQVRIGLDAGPAFAARDPLTGRMVALGRHVTRAARIEPLAVPGNVYASHQFVALLTAEQSAARLEAGMTGGAHVERWACEYLGRLPLAKGYGEQPVYHLRRHLHRRGAPAGSEEAAGSEEHGAQVDGRCLADL